MENPDLQGQAALPSPAPGVLQRSANSDAAYYHCYAIMTLRSSQSQFQDCVISYYEVDSANG